MNESKRSTVRQFVPMILFCVFLAVMMLLFLFLPKERESVNEKRVLEETPRFSFAALADGSFGTSVENYLSDHFAGRDFWVGLNARFELYSGRNGANGAYVGKDDYLINKPIVNNQENMTKSIQKINDFAVQTGLPTRVMVVPSTGYIMQDKLPALHAEYHDAEILQSAREQLSKEIQWIDLVPEFEHLAGEEQLYYKTDHHWTCAGAYAAYRQYCTAAGLTPTGRDSFVIESADGFHGTIYSKTALWDAQADSIELWRSKTGQYHVEIEEDNVQSDSLFFEKHLEKADKYPVYLDGNHSLVKITNDQAEGGTLLLVKDSFAHCAATFLADEYQQIIMVDLRYYKQPLSELCKQYQVDETLILYGIDNFVNDANLAWLK
ncbi:MAG: hypothetical protein HFE85_04390 [Clostridiales bacterium]|nr:hypothetical protein [Clostridiales bacterium]